MMGEAPGKARVSNPAVAERNRRACLKMPLPLPVERGYVVFMSLFLVELNSGSKGYTEVRGGDNKFLEDSFHTLISRGRWEDIKITRLCPQNHDSVPRK